MKKNEVILGLGSNVGNKREHLTHAISLLAEHIDNIRVSSVYESQALLPDGAPATWNIPFYNMAITGETSLAPNDVLSAIQQIEQKLGRNKIGHWCPRQIDIDILGIEDLVINSPDFYLPHKELLNRNFVLIPLAEVAPDWLHPLIKITAKELAESISQNGLSLLKKISLVGIINITPDSFSDGGINFDLKAALANIQRLIDDGADVIDIGAESTRPNATPISHEEEWTRLEPVLSQLTNIPIPISIDTRHAQTAKKALALGINWINDVSGFSSPEMVSAVRDSDCKLVVMHSLTVPADKNIILPLNSDPVELIINWAKERFAELEKAGISHDRVIFDAGIGFGKNPEQSMAIINGIARFKELSVPILIGHSRKSFLGNDASDEATIKLSQFLAENGVDYLRVHNVKRHRLEVL